MTMTFQRIVKMGDVTHDLAEEVQARKEAEPWNLRSCPCCGAQAEIHKHTIYPGYAIRCKRWGCKVVEASTMIDAAILWNEKRFTDGYTR